LAFGANQIRRGILFSLYVNVSIILYVELTHRDFPDHRTVRQFALLATCDFPFGEEKLVAPLIAIPNVDKTN
jgi:hypothetical protein